MLTSLIPEQTLPTTERHPHQAIATTGTSQQQEGSRHSSLYGSRHPSPAPPPISTQHQGAVGEMSGHPSDPRTVLPEPLAGSSSRTGSSLSSSMRSQSRQETQAEIGQQSHLATPAQPLTHHDPLPPLDLHQITSPTRPLSRRDSRPPTPTEMTLSSAISFYEETINDPSIAIPNILKQSSYKDLYVYFAYALPFDTTWGETQAGNDYLMRKIRGLNADEILQYEAERNARFLWNSVHPRNVMEELSPYIEEIEIQRPMPDDPPVPPPPPRAPVGAFDYVRGHAPPGTYSFGYAPFAGGGRAGGGGGQPAPPAPPVPPPRYALPRYPRAAPNARPTSTLATRRRSRRPL